jgi:2-oxoglutaroyl-CoA hydrolase
MLGKRVPAQEGKDIGLITDVAADGGALTEMVEGYAAKLNALAPLSMRSLKRVLNSALDSPLSVALDVEGHSYEKLRWTEDYIEGINAFSERRKPNYKGK